MARAVHACVAVIAIIVLSEGGTRAVVRFGYFVVHCLLACRCHMSVRGMSTFMHTITHDSQHDQKEEAGKEM